MLNDEQRRFIVTKIETIEENIACQKLAHRAFKVGYFGISAMICFLMGNHSVLPTFLDYLMLMLGDVSFTFLSAYNAVELVSEIIERISLNSTKESLKALLEVENIENNNLEKSR